MKRLFALLMIALALGTGWAKEAVPMAEDPVVEQRLIAISEEMRCLVCQNESLAGSRADLAQDLRRELRTLIKQGKTDAEIRDFMVERYGDFVLYRPRFTTKNFLLWSAPALLLLAGGFAAARVIRKRAAEADVDSDGEGDTT
jgi:cytochrome c-type biogenesis protein CcmH